MTTAYKYTNTSTATTLSEPLSASDNTMHVADFSSFPGDFPYTLVISPGQSDIEVVSVTGIVSDLLQVTRGEDGTAAQDHQPGATVVHAIVARDVALIQDHIDGTVVHGLTSHVVGVSDVQTLTNKAIDGSLNLLTNIPDSAIVSVSTTKLVGPTGGAPGTFAGEVTVDSLVSTGDIQGATLHAGSLTLTGALTAASGTITGTLTVGTLVLSGGAGFTVTGTSTAPRFTATGVGNVVGFYENMPDSNTSPFMDLLVNGVRKARIDMDGTVEGTDFKPLSGHSLPRGVIYGKLQTTDVHDTIGDTETDVFTAPELYLAANRTFKISVFMSFNSYSNADFEAFGWLWDNTSHVNDTGTVQMGSEGWWVRADIIHVMQTGNGPEPHTFKVSAQNVTPGTLFDIKATANHPFVFLVEDIGPSGIVDGAS